MKAPLLEIKSANGVVTEANIHIQPAPSGYLIINADDWGRDKPTANESWNASSDACSPPRVAWFSWKIPNVLRTSAREQGLDIGLHLNLTAPFSAPSVPTRLATHHQKVRVSCANRVARLLYHPGLADSFEYAVARQLEEFSRLYGRMPDRIDGHHHCAVPQTCFFKDCCHLG